jgi:hypothetical protein
VIQHLFLSFQAEGLFEELHEMNPTDTEKMYVVDAGLAFNSPFPLILRPEREVDLILSFDFSARKRDQADPFTVQFFITRNFLRWLKYNLNSI